MEALLKIPILLTPALGFRLLNIDADTADRANVVAVVGQLTSAFPFCFKRVRHQNIANDVVGFIKQLINAGIRNSGRELAHLFHTRQERFDFDGIFLRLLAFD